MITKMLIAAIFATLARAKSVVFRRISLRVWLLASVALINTAPAQAIQNDTLPRLKEYEQPGFAGVRPGHDPSFLLNATTPLQTDQTEISRTIEAFPDVVVFPILVAGPAVALLSERHSTRLAQAEGNIAVLYPDIGEPYRSIFTQIIDGIEDKAGGRVNNFAVGSHVDTGELNNSLRRQNTRVVIALGRQGVKAAAALDSTIRVVVGGILTVPESEIRDHAVNSLAPDPALLFARLKRMMPKLHRVFTVYDPRQNAWMIRLAKEAARNLGLELTEFEALDLRSAVSAYQKIIATADSSKDALWLPQDSTTVEEGTVLPMVLQASWDHNLAVFSSSFGHVRRGVLFSLYPNNLELGRHLADSALSIRSSGEHKVSGMFPLREVLMAINLRTARHLDIHTDDAQSFDMTFPAQ